MFHPFLRKPYHDNNQDILSPNKDKEETPMKAEEVGYRIAQARKKQGMTQRELSERLHVSDKAVSKWERGVSQTKRY